MAMTNAEKQKNWRERHIHKRRTVQRVTSLLEADALNGYVIFLL